MNTFRFLRQLRPYHAALLALGLLFFLPFSLAWRIGPQPGFFLEVLSLCLLLMMIAGAALSGLLPHKIPASAWWFIVFALFFFLQLLWIKLPYPGYSWLMCLLWLALAPAAWALSGLRQKIGLNAVLTVIATALLLATLWQSFVCWMQFFGVTGRFYGLMMHPPALHYVFGQLGQRNHLGHFMFWGLLATSYLFAEKRLSAYLSIFSLTVIVATLGIIGSRTIVLYVLVLLPICVFYSFRRPAAHRMAAITGAALVAVLLAQWLMPQVAGLFHLDYQTGLERAADNGGETASRFYEWHKAWLAFTDNPWIGKGWMSYAYQSVDKSRLFAFDEVPHLNVLFTHCHNLILQLLAEIGLWGTLLLCGGCLWLIRGLFRLPEDHSALLLGGALSVSLIHSLLEYPLWYVYFFLPFFVLFILAAENNATLPRPPAATSLQLMILVAACTALAATAYQSLQYKRLMELNVRTTAAECPEHAERLRQFAKQHLFFAYYADAASTQCFGVILSQKKILPQLHDIVHRTATFRPFPTQSVQWGVIQAYDGNIQSAQQWLNTVWQYYPERVRADMQTLQHRPELSPLLNTAQAVQILIQKTKEKQLSGRLLQQPR